MNVTSLINKWAHVCKASDDFSEGIYTVSVAVRIWRQKRGQINEVATSVENCVRAALLMVNMMVNTREPPRKAFNHGVDFEV